MTSYRTIDVGGVDVFYREAGDPAAQTLLLLHGNPSWCFLYRKIIASLKPSYRCVALDFPGYGMSDAPLATATPRKSTPPCSSGLLIGLAFSTSLSWYMTGADRSVLGSPDGVRTS